MTLDEKIDQARRHVESGNRIIERQRVLAARLRNAPSVDLLALFERTQQIFESRLGRLDRSEKGRARGVAVCLTKTLADIVRAFGLPLDILSRAPFAANDMELVWPFILFPEDWSGA